MRSGLWSRRLSRWRTRKSLPTDQAALRAASATARDVSLGLRPGKRAVAARAARVVAKGRATVHQVTRNQARTAQKVVISCAKFTKVTAVTRGNRTEAGGSLDFVDSTPLCRRRDQNFGLKRQ